MTQQANPTAPQQQAPNTPATFEQRMAAAIADVAPPETAADPAGTTQSPPAAPPGSAAAPVDAATKAREERAARLAALQDKGRAAVDAKARQTEADRIAREAEAAKQRVAELEARQAQLVDIAKLDEASFYELAKRANVNPQKLGEWIRESIANPERLAEHAATRAMDPKLSALEQKLQQQEQVIQQFLAQQAQQEQRTQEHAEQQRFFGFVSSSKEQAPLAHALLEKSGPEEFWKIADVAAKGLPPGAGASALLDAIEHFLDGDGRAYAQTLATIFGLAPAPSNAPAVTPKSAAAKATTNTVSNAVAQERASVVQEEELWKLPYEERLARAMR